VPRAVIDKFVAVLIAVIILFISTLLTELVAPTLGTTIVIDFLDF
jgi:hypothetical protein